MIDNSTLENKQINKSGYETIGDYIIKQTIGIGGFSKVKKGTDIRTGETVAIKIISKSKLSEHQLMRIYQEIQIQSKLLHQNIVRIYQVIQTPTKIYIILQYVPNGQVYEFLMTNGTLSEHQASKIFTSILSALIYMHSQNIAHRDIKAQNIILDYYMKPKLIDFGLAKKYESNDMLETFCGSPSYLSPQIIQKQKYNGQLTDVWSLGITLYVIVVGQYPFAEDGNFKILNQMEKKQYKKKRMLSNQLIQVFDLIFQSPQRRCNLKTLSQTSFVRKSNINLLNINYVNTKIEDIIVDELVLNQIQLIYKTPANFIRNSVKSFKLNSNSSLYYLTMNKNRYLGNQSNCDLSSPKFHKIIKKPRQQKVSLPKIKQNSQKAKQKRDFRDKLALSLVKKKKSLPKIIIQSKIDFLKSIQTKDFKIRTKRNIIDIEESRLRRANQSPDSPRRILDLVAHYHQNHQHQYY